MRPIYLEICNVRGIETLSLPVRDLTTLIGPNNAGKSTVLDAIRLFYGDLKWDDSRDWPWDEDSGIDLGGSYVCITYEVEDGVEAHELDFHADGDRLKLCRCFIGGIDSSGYQYQAGTTYSVPSERNWVDDEIAVWDASPVSLGSVVYVPALADLADHTRTAESSMLREVMQRALNDAEAYNAIQQVSGGLAKLRATLAHGKGPARRLENRLSEALSPWGLDVNIDVTDLTPEIVLDQMLRLQVVENGHHAALGTQGLGVQRVALAALIQAASELRQSDHRNSGFTWVLFEEPETHLHPAHIGRLGDELARLARTEQAFVMTTTHSTAMLAAQGRLDSVVRLHRGQATAPSHEDIRAATRAISRRSAYTEYARRDFRGGALVATAAQTTERMLRDLDARRAAAFFADRVVVVEGFSDCALFDWLERHGMLAPLGANVGVLDAGGKYELHRAMTTLSLFGIPHVVLWDEDAALVRPNETAKREKRARQDEAAWQAIRAAANEVVVHGRERRYGSAVGGIRLSGTIESWLGIHQEGENAWKAANIATALDAGSPLEHDRAAALVTLLTDMFDGKPMDPHRNLACFRDCLIAPPFPPPTVDFDDLPTG